MSDRALRLALILVGAAAAVLCGLYFAPSYAAIVLLFVASLAPAIYFGARGRVLEEPIVPLGVSFAIFYGLSSIGLVMRGVERYPEFFPAMILVVVGLVAAYVAYGAGGRVASAAAGAVPVPGPDWLSGRRLALMVLVLVALGAIGLRSRFHATGGLAAFSDEGALPTALQTEKLGGTTWSIPLLLCPSIALVLSYAYIADRRARQWWIPWLLAVATYLVIYAMVGSRSRLLAALAPLVVLRHFLVKRLSTRLAASFLGAVWGLYVIFGQVRTHLFTAPDRALEQLSNDDLADNYLAEHGDLMELRATLTVMRKYPDRHPYLLGSTLITPVTTWVPRALWPGKPDSAASIYTAREYPAAWSRGATSVVGMPGELFMNFGALGVILGMAGLGFGTRIIREYRERRPKDAGVNVLYALMLLPIATTARGDIAFVINGAETALFWAFGALWMSRGLGLAGRQRSRKPLSEASARPRRGLQA